MKFYLINLESSNFFEIRDQLTVGRKKCCDLTIKDDLVSGKHCKFHINSHRIYIEDLDASNPVEVNNEQINSRSRERLNITDKIKIGSSAYYLSDHPPRNEHTYKSLILEKVKIHETFDEDSNYEENEKHWKGNQLEAQLKQPRKSTSSPLFSKSSDIKEKKGHKQNHELADIKEKLTQLEEKIARFKKYTPEEVSQKIDLYSEKINQYTKKRDELFAIQTLYEQYLEYKMLEKKLE